MQSQNDGKRSSKLHVCRQLYSSEKPGAELGIEGDIQAEQEVFNQERKRSPIQDALISPGSLKVSISRVCLKESPVKTQRKPSLEEETTKKEYPKRRRIDRLSYLESGNDYSPRKQVIQDAAGSVERKASEKSVESNKSGQENRHKDAPIDVLLLDGSKKEFRPVIPKLVLKRVKRKMGSKEFDTMEIVSPTKAELGIYYNDDEIRGGAMENDAKRKSTESEIIMNYSIRSIDDDVIEERESEGREETRICVNDNVLVVSENEKKIDENFGFSGVNSLKNREDEQRLSETSERRALRKKRRRLSSESEDGEVEFTDALQVYGSKISCIHFSVN